MGKVLIWFVIIISTVVLYCLMKVKEFADYLYDRENANATVDKYVADIKNSFPFYRIK